MRENKERKCYIAFTTEVPQVGKMMYCGRIQYEAGVGVGIFTVSTSVVKSVEILDNGFYKVETVGSTYFVKVLSSSNNIHYAMLIELPRVGDVFSCMELKLKNGFLDREPRRTTKVSNVVWHNGVICEVVTRNSRYFCLPMA